MLRPDADLMAHFRAGEPGWQTGVNHGSRHVVFCGRAETRGG